MARLISSLLGKGRKNVGSVSEHFRSFVEMSVNEPASLFEKSRRGESGGVANLNGLWDWVGMAPRMGPKSLSCTFPLGWPVSRCPEKQLYK